MGWKRYHEDWVNPDFAPDGVRASFINGDGNFVSAYIYINI